LVKQDNNAEREILMNVGEFLKKRSKPSILIVGVVLVLFLGVIDVLTGPELSFSVFYLLAVYLVTWHISRWVGVLISLASAITWLIADFLAGHIYSHPLIPFWNMIVRLCFFLIMTYLLSELKTKLEWEQKSARTDPLTKIPNRRYFVDLAEMELARAHRHHYPLAVAYIDLDNLKLVNDRFGHATGDTLLSLVASTIQKNLRRSDVVARMGGDEFAILLPEAGGDFAQECLFGLRNLLADMMQEKKWPVTFSIGAITFIRLPDSVDEMIKRADDFMYSVKRSGKHMIKHEVFR